MSASLRKNEIILRIILPVLMPSIKHVTWHIKHDEFRGLKKWTTTKVQVDKVLVHPNLHSPSSSLAIFQS